MSSVEAKRTGFEHEPSEMNKTTRARRGRTTMIYCKGFLKDFKKSQKKELNFSLQKQNFYMATIFEL